MADQTKEEKLVVAVASGEAIPTVVLGMSDAAWEYCAEGKTHLLDMTKFGIPAKLVLFGCRDHAHAAQLVGTLGNNAAGRAAVSAKVPDTDLGIAEGSHTMKSFLKNRIY